RARAAGALEAHLVPRLRVARVHFPADRIHRKVEDDRADAVDVAGLHQRVRIDREHVLVGERETDGVAPVARELVLPLAIVRIEFDDETGLRLLLPAAVEGIGSGKAARRAAHVDRSRAGSGRPAWRTRRARPASPARR